VFAAGAVIAALMLQRRSSGSFVNDSTYSF
jgi:hypothetical protein